MSVLRSIFRRPFKPDWEVPPAPCEAPALCSPQTPRCGLCLTAMRAYNKETEALAEVAPNWAELEEWQREAWRREVADA